LDDLESVMRLNKALSTLRSPSLLFYKLAKGYVRSYEGYSYRFSKNGEARLLEQLAPHHMKTVFDVGANVGDWSVLAADRFAGADIHAFELSETTFKALKPVASQHGFTANNCGLSDSSAEITYKDYGDGSTVNTIVESADFHDTRLASTEKRARVMRGDDYCAQNSIEQIDLLKIDVEGAEHLVLHGFERMFSEKRIAVVQFEYGFVNGDAHFLMKDFFKLFQSWGYTVGPLKPKGAIFKDFDYPLNSFKSGPNYVAVSSDRPDLIEAVEGPSIKGFF
jgi:FkbM family methyltransferase